MKLKSTLLFLFLLGALGATFAQVRQGYCIENAVIRAPGGQSELYFCEGDGLPDRVRFTVSPFAQPFAYLITDDKNVIIRVSRDNRLDLEGLGSGQFRVWAFAYLGNILAEPGQDATTAVLADICYSLTTNFIPVNGVTPDGGTVSTESGQSAVFTCRDDGNADVLAFSTTSADPLYTYVITDTDNTILAFAEDGSFDFEMLTPEKVRVWGASYVGGVNAAIGDNLLEITFASGCFDLSDNFIEVTRTIPDGGTVALATGETNKTICAESLDGNVLSFVNQTEAETPYAFIVTDENGVVLSVLAGNTADFDIVEPGICRVYGVSYTGSLVIAEGDNINADLIADDCFDLSDNFVQISKQEVDGGRVQLAGGGVNTSVCVVNDASETLSFENTSSAGANYVYIITDANNLILAVIADASFNFADLDNRANRIWGVSFSGTLQAQAGRNITTAALSSECYDLSDNFVAVTRKLVDGSSIALESGATEAAICGNDGEPDILGFSNNSTSVESYIYVVTDADGTVIGFINGNAFNFDDIGVNIAFVYGLSYSGALELEVGDNINEDNLAEECADISDNVVTITNVMVDGGEVSLADGAVETTLCAGSDATNVLNFNTTSASDENYAFVITDTDNVIIAIAEGAAYDFSGNTDATFRVWGLSFSGNVLVSAGDDADEVALTDGCFELSANFITVNRIGVDGATVSTESGTTEVIVCTTETQPGEVAFANTSAVVHAYAYVLATAEDVVLQVTTDNTFDFTNFAEGSFRVYGVSYTGNLTINTDDDLRAIALSDECFDLSENFVAISIQDVQGGTISLADGATEALVCIGDPVADTLNFVNTSGSDNPYVYLLTDETNFIIATFAEDFIPIENLEPGTYRIWGLSYTGLLLASPALIADEVRLARECFELSENFVTLNVNVVDGGRISLENGDTTAIACVEQPLDLTFVNNTTATADFRYLITDVDNNIVALPEGDAYSFDTLSAGSYRVWGVSYTGDFTAQTGDDAELTALASECFALSSNFIAVELQAVDGGTVSLTGGGTTAAVCGFGSGSGTLSFTFNSTSAADYAFVITDSRGRIFAILNGNSVSFNGVRIGTYRVYGVSYTGEFMASINDEIEGATFSNECFDLSDNFVTVRKEETDGGTIASVSGDEAFNFCPGNGIADLVELTTDGNSSGTYAYVLTNAANEFISVIEGASIDFDTLTDGVYRIWGLAFTGNLLIQPGDNAAQVAITDECFDLSDNFITVMTETPDGGSVFTIDNTTEEFTCPADGTPDVIEFYSDGATGANFVFLITDENNIIEAITEEGSFDFERDTEGVNRIWGLAYTGNLTAQIGDDAAATDLSDDCFDLSDNFVEIIREIPFGGDVLLQNGDTIAFVCSEGEASVLQFDSTGTSRGEYIYVITDESNVIRNGIFGDRFDFSFLPLGTYRVWGLAYTGMLTAAIGDTVNLVPISDDCYDLSETFATVVVSVTDGATVSLEGGATEVSICVGDGERDELTFVNTSTSVANYAYLITDKNNGFLTLAMGDGFDFETNDPDTCRVWGISYAGELQLTEGEDVTTAMLADGCFDLSENFIQVARLGVDGGSVATNFNSETIFTCVNDGISDLVQFSNTSSVASNYIYVLTNENNVIRGTVSGEQFDFETAGVGVTRVWGVSYTGSFTGNFGASVTTAALSDGCFELSENFITVARDQPFGGDVTTADGETSAFYCPSPATPGIEMATTSDTRVGYVYLVTNQSNDILAFSETSAVDLSGLPVGTYRIWGLSYTGTLQFAIGDNILGAAPLASSCFEISSAFVEVFRATSVDGGTIANLEGENTLYVCPNDSADIVSLFNDSEAMDADYRYVLTNMNNVIISRNLESEVINFNDATPGAYRIWGVSFTGSFLALSGDDVTTAVLTDSCYETSTNFISVFVDTPEGGTVATSDSLTEISVVQEDGLPDLYSFINLDASIVKYRYIVTDENNEIVSILDDDTIDFEALPTVGFLRVWGVAYTGNFTAQVGDNAAETALSDDCFDLSDNFVLVAVAVPATDGDAPVLARQSYETPMPTVTAEYSPLQLGVYPNPAIDRISVTINAERPQEEKANLRIYSLTGQLMYQDKVQIEAGANQVEVQISNLPDGLYLLQLRNGEKVKTIRFMKQWQ